MNGLPQAGLLAQELLEKWLAKNGYTQSKLTPGLWMHHTRPIKFHLIVNYSGVKYEGKEHADITTDWRGEKYIGLTLGWD